MSKLKVMSWNVWNNEKLSNVIKQLKYIDADISCCQEVSLAVSEHIADELNQYFYFHGDSVIFSKIAPRDRTYRIIPSADKHSYIEVELALSSRSLTVGTVHLTYSKEFLLTSERQQEAEYLLGLIKNRDKTFILTGDLNAMPDSYLIKQLEGYLVPAGPDHAQNTWTTKPFSYQGFEANSLDWRLDYIFTTPDIKVLSSRTIKTKFSDHLPVVAEVEV